MGIANKKPVICFAVGNIDYLDPIIVASNSFAEYNPDIELVVFVSDNSAELFREKIKLRNISFENYNDSRVDDFCRRHMTEFGEGLYAFDNSKMSSLFMANSVLDTMISRYADEYDVLIRLDMDVVFTNSIMPSVKNFIKSNCVVGSVMEHNHKLAIPMENFKNPDIDNYMNAGCMMFRLNSITIRDHLSEGIYRIVKLGLSSCPFPDQDALNLIYELYDKYDSTKDGWLIPMVEPSSYDGSEIIFIHYASVTKPFNYTNKRNITWHILRDSYSYYKDCAVRYGCSDEFIEKISSVISSIKTQKDTMSDTVSRLQFRKIFKSMGIC